MAGLIPAPARRACVRGAVLAWCVLLGTVGPVSGFDILDTEGFEAYSVGQLSGQFAGLSTWTTIGSGGGAAGVQDGVGLDGSRGVRVDRGARSDDWWAAPLGGFGWPNQRFLFVDWDMRVEETGAAGGVLGPFIGVDVYDDSFFPKLLASLGVDATTREVLYQDPSTGFFVESGLTVDTAWRHYQLRLDYLSSQYTVAVDGASLTTEPIGFIDGSSTTFGDADLAAYAAEADQASQKQQATAYFDNLQVREAMLGDYNLDGTVDSADYAVWRNNLNAAGYFLAADGDGNGLVDHDDYLVWRESYGTAESGVALGSPAPEPSGVSMLLISAGALLSTSQQKRGAVRDGAA